jgi:hypothetical protein
LLAHDVSRLRLKKLVIGWFNKPELLAVSPDASVWNIEVLGIEERFLDVGDHTQPVAFWVLWVLGQQAVDSFRLLAHVVSLFELEKRWRDCPRTIKSIHHVYNSKHKMHIMCI